MALYAFDGTHRQDEVENERDTNVVRFARAYRGRRFYRPGVGTRLGFVGRVFGGWLGAGLQERVEEGLDARQGARQAARRPGRSGARIGHSAGECRGHVASQSAGRVWRRRRLRRAARPVSERRRLVRVDWRHRSHRTLPNRIGLRAHAATLGRVQLLCERRLVQVRQQPGRAETGRSPGGMRALNVGQGHAERWPCLVSGPRKSNRHHHATEHRVVGHGYWCPRHPCRGGVNPVASITGPGPGQHGGPSRGSPRGGWRPRFRMTETASLVPRHHRTHCNAGAFTGR